MNTEFKNNPIISNITKLRSRVNRLYIQKTKIYYPIKSFN